MKKKISFFIFLLLLSGQERCARSNFTVIPLENGVELRSGNFNQRVQFYSDAIVRVTKWSPQGRPNQPSLVVIAAPLPALQITHVSEDKRIKLESPALVVTIDKSDGKISYARKDGTIILREKGRPDLRPIVYAADSGFSVRQNFILSPNEGIYGLGQHQTGDFNYRGKTVVLVQANTEASIPFLISTRNYGILWDNYSKTIFADQKQATYFWSDMGDNIDYYFISGANMDGVISGYRQLTGKAPLYGKWAYGYWQSKEHYDNQAEITAVAEKYRRMRIPIDNLIQDWDYWNGAPNWGGMFFAKELFPHPKEMCDYLHRLHYHLIISIWPAFGPQTAIYAEMAKNGFLYKPVGWAGFKYYDAFNPAANRLYWQHLKRGLYSQGLDGWWIDSTEPDVVNAMTKESSEYELKKMGRNHLGSWARYLNAYSLVMTEALHKAWRTETSERRAYLLTRSTFAGQQRNAATTWSGDIGASWEVYRRQIAAGLNHCLAGVPYWTFDIGAFVLGAYEGVFMRGGKDPAYQELYTRMFQFGAFTPIFRSHGSETPREIWEMGEFVEPILKFDQLRYRLLPYIYSLAWMVTAQDYTIMRGLPMDFAYDQNTHQVADQFMFGPSLLICPVTDWMYHRPPEPSRLITREFFQTKDGQPGLRGKYYRDAARRHLSREQIDPIIDIIWYTGRPTYVTDSTYAIRWEGYLIPQETGPHQFHLLSYDPKRIILNGDTLRMVYTSVEQYTELVHLEAGRKYELIVETENRSTGAARMRLFWKTPTAFAREKEPALRNKVRPVYLPANQLWFDFWTGRIYEGGQVLQAAAPIDIIPLYVKAGSILPLGPFLQYASEKPAEPLELRIYPGADGQFTLYEDENDNYNYEKGLYATITFSWNDQRRELIIGKRKGSFPGMLRKRTINLVLVKEGVGTGLSITSNPSRTVIYDGNEQLVRLGEN